MATDAEAQAGSRLDLGILYISIVGILGTVGGWLTRTVLGDSFLLGGIITGIAAGGAVVWRLHNIALPRQAVDFGTFVVSWLVLSFIMMAAALFGISQFVGVDLADYFSAITAVIFLIGLSWYLATKWPNYLGRARTD